MIGYPTRREPPEKNPLTDLQPMVIPWVELEAYFKDAREQVILDLADAETDRNIWKAQGKLKLLDELARLRIILQVLDSQGKE